MKIRPNIASAPGLLLKRSLVWLSSAVWLVSPPLAFACPSGNSSSSTSTGCCYSGAHEESEPVEREFDMTGMYTELYSDTCNADESYTSSIPLASTRTVLVPPWTQVCGVNYHAESISYFPTTGPENCSNCGFLQKYKNTQENCS